MVDNPGEIRGGKRDAVRFMFTDRPRGNDELLTQQSVFGYELFGYVP